MHTGGCESTPPAFHPYHILQCLSLLSITTANLSAPASFGQCCICSVLRVVFAEQEEFSYSTTNQCPCQKGLLEADGTCVVAPVRPSAVNPHAWGSYVTESGPGANSTTTRHRRPRMRQLRPERRPRNPREERMQRMRIERGERIQRMRRSRRARDQIA